ncbi:hypothetical protein EGW08_010674 [Elysia chlorotica]|uniref:Ionotropic glutamate receptor C-terminal domain-containing protein n=1 Tax=Elysia chlorotica TaxID=188477 RepID=A0A3S0ZSD0_ELYCH|nr:hypothetical protein EGW08_010674 [Elysia chlorotica]
MNGRHLVFLSKEWENFLAFHDDEGATRYSGLLSDLADVLSTSMNFTFSFQPDPKVSRNMSWDDLRDLLISGGIGDSLFSLFYTTASITFNFSQPQPIFHVNMTGTYVSKPHARVVFSISAVDPKLFIFSAIVFMLVLIIYSCLLKFSKMYSSGNTITEARNVQARFGRAYLRTFLHQTWDMMFSLLGSCFSQGNVPQSLLFSGNCFLFSWCMFVLTLTAVFKGHITSSLIKVQPSPPFRTFRELAARTDYRWGHHRTSTFFPVMAAARGGTLSQLYSGMMRFARDDPAVIAPDLADLMIKAAGDEHFVVIIDSFYLKEFLHSEKIGHVKVIPDSLGINGLAPALPRDSELTQFMSEHILALHETHMFNVIVENMFRRLEENKSTPNATVDAQKDENVQIHDVKAENRIDISIA